MMVFKSHMTFAVTSPVIYRDLVVYNLYINSIYCYSWEVNRNSNELQI